MCSVAYFSFLRDHQTWWSRKKSEKPSLLRKQESRRHPPYQVRGRLCESREPEIYKSGFLFSQETLDSRFLGNDENGTKWTFYEIISVPNQTFLNLEFWIWDLFRISIFGFRIFIALFGSRLRRVRKPSWFGRRICGYGLFFPFGRFSWPHE